MRTDKRILFCLVLALSGAHRVSFSAETAPPLKSGDMITREYSKPEQDPGGGPVTFKPTKSTAYVLLIEDDLRKLLRANGTIAAVADRKHTTIFRDNAPVEPDRRFLRLPPEQPIQPGMKWAVPTWKSKVSCGFRDVSFEAASEKGPDHALLLDGKLVTVETIRINYDARNIPVCEGPWKYRKTVEVLYAPDLDEVLSHKALDWSAYGVDTLIAGGDGWRVTAIATGNGPNQKARGQ